MGSLASGTHGLAFASGLAATTTAMLLLDPGDHVVYMEDAYGGTFRLFDRVMRRYGLTFSAVDASQPGASGAASPGPPRRVWTETPPTPLPRVADTPAAAGAAHRHGAH